MTPKKNIAKILTNYIDCLEEDVLNQEAFVLDQLHKAAKKHRLSWEIDCYYGVDYVFSLYLEDLKSSSWIKVVTERGKALYWLKVSSFACYFKNYTSSPAWKNGAGDQDALNGNIN